MSREELFALIAGQAELIRVLRVENEGLRGEVAELKRRLGLNSSNSSKPPSSDGLAKPAPRSLRRVQGRKQGGQPGSPGASLSQVGSPDETVVHRPAQCDGCQADLAAAPQVGLLRRQVFDLPVIRARVTEHQLVSCRCSGCGTVSMAAAPAGVNAPVQYGPGLIAAAAYLGVGHHLPVARVAQILADLCGVQVSAGWAGSVNTRIATALTGFRQRLRDVLGQSRVIGFDETGARVCDRLRWIHVACTPWLTSYHLDGRRGQTAIDAHAILPAMTAPQVAVHDGWIPYAKACYTGADHALCNAHHLRELDGWAEHDPAANGWAAILASLLREGNRLVKQAKAAGHDHLTPDVLDDLPRRWDEAVQQAYQANPPPEGKRRGPILALIDRMSGYTTEIWRFTHDFAVPFDNNQSERDIRMVKLQLKISGAWRTETGATQWLQVREYISTLRKNGIHILTALRDAITGNPWLPPLPE